MKIELTIRRKNGSKVELGGRTYHFKPDDKDPGGPHVAEVTEPAHVERLLAIPEYRKADTKAAKAEAQTLGTLPATGDAAVDAQTKEGQPSALYDTGLGMESYANTPQSAKPTVQEAEQAIQQEHEKQAQGEGGSQAEGNRAPLKEVVTKVVKQPAKKAAKKTTKKA